MRWIFDEYLGGKGSYTIAAELETAGIPTIRGAKEWQDSVVKGILQNCAYEGDLLLQKTYTTDGAVSYTHLMHVQFLMESSASWNRNTA